MSANVKTIIHKVRNHITELMIYKKSYYRVDKKSYYRVDDL